MPDEETPKFERAEYEDMEEGISKSQYTIAVNDLTVKPQCDTGDCTCKVEEPAEAAWIKLMSAVPQATQINNLRAAREGTMMLPEGQTIQSMVASIRPQPEADYALDTIRDAWTDFYEEFRIIGPSLEAGLRTLSSGWKGDDFDAFEDQVETVLKNCKTIQNDIGGDDGVDGVIKVLDTKQSEIFDQQGGTACVYPAPKFYMEGTSCGSHRIHIRPPFFRNCEIRANDETKAALEIAGFDPMIVDEVSDGRQRTYDMWLEYLNNNPDYEEGGLKGQALAESKAEEYATNRLETLGPKGSKHLDEQAAIVNEEVTERHSNVEAQVTEIEPDSKPSEPTTFNDGSTEVPPHGGLDTGGGGGMPDLSGGGAGGLDGMSKPNGLKDLNSTGPGGLGDTSGGLNGGLNGGNAPSDYAGGSDLTSLEENPFGSNIDDPDNLGGTPPGGLSGGSDLSGSNPWSSKPGSLDGPSGGLASGGGLGTPPGGLGGGGGLSSGGGGTLPGGGSLPGAVSPSTIGGRNLTPTSKPPTSSIRPKGVSMRPGSTIGKSGGLTGAPGKGGGVGGLKGGGGVGGSSGLRGGGMGGGSGSGSGLRGGMGAAGAAGLTAGAAGGKGAAGAGGHGMIPGAAGARGPGDEAGSEHEVWLVEDDDVWGGVPEDEEDDPYA
ncbi:hypothetical protein AB0B28_12265 [Glycomyces sp. NPDC046736]|uniref:hypothetical protein n=1 Tax=Glycomyces sp. NPDC046736 TaxID=3155615 RepID=UPI0033ED4C0C